MKSKQVQEFKDTEIGKIPKGWNVMTILDCASKEAYSTQIGPFGNALMSSEYTTSGVPVLRGVNVNLGRFHDDNFVFVSEEKANGLKKFESFPEDVLLVHKGTIGKIGLMPLERKFPFYLLGNSMMRIRCDQTKLLPKFLYLWLSSFFGQNYLYSRISQVGVPQLQTPLTTLREAKLGVPPISVQSVIVDHIFSLEEVIESLQNQNKVLKQLVKAIFKSWFVDFDGITEFEDSELGDIPKGWHAGTFSDIIDEIESGKRPKGGINSSDTEVPSIGAENIISLGEYNYSKTKYVSSEFFNQMKTGKIKDNDVLLYKDGASLGRKSLFRNDFPFKQCCINEHVFILRPNKKISALFLYFWLDQNWMEENVQNLNSNSAQPGINKPNVLSLPILIPEINIINSFQILVDPIITKFFKNLKLIENLTKTHDTLLPKLISGKIRV